MINDIIQLLGIANPQLKDTWTSGGANALPVHDSKFTLTFSSSLDSFLAPVSGFLDRDTGLDRIVMPGGTPPGQGTIILKTDPQAYLRISRLYATQLEGKTVATHRTERPVPFYFVYRNLSGLSWQDDEGVTQNGPMPGVYQAGQTLSLKGGTLTIHDQYGQPIDPLAVINAFNHFIATFATMQVKPLTLASAPAPLNAGSQLAVMAGQAPVSTFPANPGNLTTIHLITPGGDPFTTGDTVFTNLANVDRNVGLYEVRSPATVIAKTTPGTDMKISAATNGVFADTYTVLPLQTNLRRDFLRAYVIPVLSTYLLGSAPSTEPSVAFGTAPLVRDNEQLTVLTNGNACLAAVSTIIAPPPSPARNRGMLVSQVIDTDFVVPPAATAAANAIWPNYPAAGPGAPGSTAALPASARNSITVSASFVNDPATYKADVAVTIGSAAFSAGDSIRVYNRVFHEDGSETRGNGAGAIIGQNGITTLRLSDPLGLVNAQNHFTPPPGVATLMLDVVVVNRASIKRTFGNIHCQVSPAPLNPVQPIPNLATFGQVPEMGISPAGISGTSSAFPTTPITSVGDFLLNGVIDATLGEGPARKASRFPTMARNGSMAASLKPGGWQAFCGGTIFKKDALSNAPLLGNPGSPGGREFSSVGVLTQNGLLAYDIARAAYRRTRNIVERMNAMMFDGGAADWIPPAGANPTPGTWAAAALQTIAPHCETPELALAFKDMSGVPIDFPTLMAQLQTALGLGTLPGWIPAPLAVKLNALIANFNNDPNHQRGYAEFRQEVVTSLNGRRDAFWAMQGAVGKARECIYIQGTYLSQTAYGNDGSIEDLLDTLATALQTHTRLRVILCLSRTIRMGKGYEAFEAREYKQRLAAVNMLQGIAPGRVLAFHPGGFPMRSKELLHQVVIVDDMWAMVGSSTFRRRGLHLDGSEDVVMLDKTVTNGKSAGVKALRLALMREHLNLEGNALLTPGLQVRLNDLHESFTAIDELLSSGGAGMISPIWAGDRGNLTSLPADGLADPNFNTFGVENILTDFLNTSSTSKMPA